MPSAKFVKSSQIGNSFRVEKIKGSFDLSNITETSKSFDIDIPIEGEKWNVGLIVGSSGSGKTTIAKELFKDFFFFDGFEWDAQSMIDDFPASISANEIAIVCNSVGLFSAPDWLKPFAVLSNGQKMRAELARLFCEVDKPVIYDEFTSVVDRQVAQVSSYAVSKFIRKHDKQFIAVSCHRDIVDWLDADWVFDTDANSFSWRLLQGRPKIELKIRKAAQSEWQLFKSHHYLSGEHHIVAHKYIAEINNVPVGWCSIMAFPHPIVKNLWRIHRLVVRPDYQGLGIGGTLLNYVASSYVAKGKRVSIVSSLAYLLTLLNKTKNWKLKRQGHAAKVGGHKNSMKKNQSGKRMTFTFEYSGGVTDE